MRGESHRVIARYLAAEYLAEQPECHVRAFLLGSIQPDRNPATYLKGSLRCQWLRGHNYANSLRYMRRLSRRLERKSNYTIPDYYALGKLIHYTADAFTYAHNSHFPKGMDLHRAYERKLQNYFVPYILSEPASTYASGGDLTDLIQRLHREYMKLPPDIETDTLYILTACRSIFHHLAGKNCQIKKHFLLQSSTTRGIMSATTVLGGNYGTRNRNCTVLLWLLLLFYDKK